MRRLGLVLAVVVVMAVMGAMAAPAFAMHNRQHDNY